MAAAVSSRHRFGIPTYLHRNPSSREILVVKLHKETAIAGLALVVVLAFAAVWFMPAGLREAPPLVGQTLDGRT